ncbi:MAG TPA: hypothetical protein VFM90_00530 [Cyclobacteriaceae bacterium]|nr:hypothetical protein [Cyclobacteriaceae bacterium]
MFRWNQGENPETVTDFVLMITFVLPGTSQQKKEFTNPILAGFYPDPSICQAGDDYNQHEA